MHLQQKLLKKDTYPANIKEVQNKTSTEEKYDNKIEDGINYEARENPSNNEGYILYNKNDENAEKYARRNQKRLRKLTRIKKQEFNESDSDEKKKIKKNKKKISRKSKKQT